MFEERFFDELKCAGEKLQRKSRLVGIRERVDELVPVPLRITRIAV